MIYEHLLSTHLDTLLTNICPNTAAAHTHQPPSLRTAIMRERGREEGRGESLVIEKYIIVGLNTEDSTADKAYTGRVFALIRTRTHTHTHTHRK